MALNQLVEFPELIGGQDEEENDDRWQERTRSIGASMHRQSVQLINTSKNNRKTVDQFNLAVPENILAPIVKLEPSKATIDA